MGDEGTDNEHALWPRTQPRVSNRESEIHTLWNPDETKNSMTRSILTVRETGFDSQAACSTLFSLKATQDDEGAHTMGVVGGVQADASLDDFEFTDLLATRSNLEEMDQCYKAFVVSCLWCCHQGFFSGNIVLIFVSCGFGCRELKGSLKWSLALRFQRLFKPWLSW